MSTLKKIWFSKGLSPWSDLVLGARNEYSSIKVIPCPEDFEPDDVTEVCKFIDWSTRVDGYMVEFYRQDHIRSVRVFAWERAVIAHQILQRRGIAGHLLPEITEFDRGQKLGWSKAARGLVLVAVFSFSRDGLRSLFRRQPDLARSIDNCITIAGRSALHVAVMNSRRHAALFLLEAGANKWHLDESGRTCFENGHEMSTPAHLLDEVEEFWPTLYMRCQVAIRRLIVPLTEEAVKSLPIPTISKDSLLFRQT